MRDRGKALDNSTINNVNGDLFHDPSSYLPCIRHPSSSPIGICPHCLKERLLSLVCSDCGERRLSTCSCTQISPNRASHSSNSNSNVDVGSVGRVSFLIENDAQPQSHQTSSTLLKRSNSNKPPPAEVLILKRSSSSCVEIKRRKGGFWKIGRFFTKRSSKEKVGGNGSLAGIEDRNGDLWVLDDDYAAGGGCGGMVSRSRSLCSFRGGGGGFFAGSEDGTYSGARSSVSGARSSISAARSSGFNGLVFDPDRKSGYSEYSEPRKSGFDVENQKRDYSIPRVFSLREGNFTTAVDDSGFIDLKFDFPSSESKPPPTAEAAEFAEDGNGGSFRVMTVSDRGIKRSRKSFKSWRWIFRHHHHHHHHQQSNCNNPSQINVVNNPM